MRGSLHYNGQKIILNPGVQTIADGLQANLEFRTIGENAEFAVLRLKNTGAANTGRITAVKTLDQEFPCQEAPRYHSLKGDS